MKSYVSFLFLSLQSFGFANSIDIGSKYFDEPNNACTDYQGSILEQSEDYMIGFAFCDKQNIMFLSKKYGSTTQKGTPQKLLLINLKNKKIEPASKNMLNKITCELEGE